MFLLSSFYWLQIFSLVLPLIFLSHFHQTIKEGNVFLSAAGAEQFLEQASVCLEICLRLAFIL
jgi:hypothetical protein